MLSRALVRIDALYFFVRTAVIRVPWMVRKT